MRAHRIYRRGDFAPAPATRGLRQQRRHTRQREIPRPNQPRPQRRRCRWRRKGRHQLRRLHDRLQREGSLFDRPRSPSPRPALLADLFGDWREEVVLRTTDNTELRIFTTPIPTEHRGYTLLHDPVYRLSVAWQNSAYNQPTHTGFYLGAETKEFPRPNIVLANSR